MSENKNFRKQFWKNRKMIGSMVPSSTFLRNKMLKNIDFEKTTTIVELGPGTGIFTKEIIKRMGKNSTLLVFEINDTFYENLKENIKDERVHLIKDSAENINEYLAKYQLNHADAVISSLPLAVFPEELRINILNATKQAIKENGLFIQFQYTLQAKSILKAMYKEVKISFTPFNIPPAFVYRCSK